MRPSQGSKKKNTLKKVTPKKPSKRAPAVKVKKNLLPKSIQFDPIQRTLMDTAASAILVIDTRGKIIAANPRLCSLFGIEESKILDWNESRWIEYLESTLDNPDIIAKNREQLDSSSYTCSDEVSFKAFANRFFQRQIQPILDSKNKSAGRLWKFRDVTYERHVEVIYRDIEKKKFELESKNQQLQLAYKELGVAQKSVDEANTLKSQFLSNMSHELRTPLNSILALSSILLARMDGEITEEQEKQIKIIEKSGKNLLRLINDILDLSKMDSGRMDLFFAEYSIPEFAQTIHSTIQPMLRETSLQFKIEIDDELDIHSTDENKLKQIILNLLSNAIKFTPQGSISLQIKPTKFVDVIDFSVIDTGIGIDQSNFDKIFDPFRQIDGSATRRYGGTGLGLAVTKKMIELLGGKITVESELGKGSVFKFVIPSKKQGDNPKPLTEDQINAMFLASSPKNGISDSDDVIAIDPAKKTILLVDDDHEAIYIAKKYLADGPYNVLTAKDGDAAIAMAKSYLPDIITLDIMLPKKDGWEVLQDLKKNPATLNIPIAIVSMIDNKKLGFSLGAADYLVKPVTREMFLKRLNKLHESRGLKKILIVDDDLSQAELVEEILESDDFNSEVATSGDAAIAMARRNSYSLVILDLLMPNIDGFAVLKNLQTDPLTEKVPVLVLTGKLLTQEDQKKLSGKHYYIFQKSMFSREKLLEQIYLILEKEKV